MHEIIHRLTDPQYDFVHSADRFPLFLGGFGAGKSEALVCRMLRLLGDNPGCNVGYFGLPQSMATFIGGCSGFIGTEKLRDLAIRFGEKKAGA